MALSMLVATLMASSSPAAARDDEDPFMASVDDRALPDAPPEAGGPGTPLTLAANGDVLTVTVPPDCAGWRLGEEIVLACTKAAWPKLNGRVSIRLGARRGPAPPLRADPDWSGMPPPFGQYRMQARKSLGIGDHLGNVEAYCDNAWRYCTEMRVDGALYGPRTVMRFAAATWDGGTARRLGDAIVAASTLSRTATATAGGNPDPRAGVADP